MENHAFVADNFDNLKTLQRKERTLLVSICPLVMVIVYKN